MKVSMKWMMPVWGAVLASGVAFADVPPAGQVHIRGIQAGGNGCAQGTFSSYLSEDQQAFTLMFDAYTATQSRGSNPADARRFCNINLDLHIPHGWQYSIFKVDYRGYASLDAGVRGVVQSSYRFSGGGASTRPLQQVLTGPVATDYLKSDSVGISSLVWSPCGVSRALNIKSEVRLEGDRNRSGLLTVDTIDGEFKQIYALQWRRC
jgi:hypothetical protein